MVLYKLLPTKLSVAIKPLDGPVVNLSNWGFEWAGKSTWQLAPDHLTDVKYFYSVYSPRHIQQRISLVSQPLVLARVVLVRAAASSGSKSLCPGSSWSPGRPPQHRHLRPLALLPPHPDLYLQLRAQVQPPPRPRPRPRPRPPAQGLDLGVEGGDGGRAGAALAGVRAVSASNNVEQGRPPGQQPAQVLGLCGPSCNK